MGHHRGSTDDSPPILTKVETRNTDGDLPTVIPMGMEMRKRILSSSVIRFLPSFQPKGQEMCKVQHVVGRFGFLLTV